MQQAYILTIDGSIPSWRTPYLGETMAYTTRKVEVTKGKHKGKQGYFRQAENGNEVLVLDDGTILTGATVLNTKTCD